MLFGSELGQRLEPVCNMRYSVVQSPFLYTAGDFVGSGQIQRTAVVHTIGQRLEYIDVEVFTHLFPVEDQLAE